MLKFAALSTSQKKCVVALIEAQPSLKTNSKITLKEVVAITQELAAKRDAGAPKIGYPNWLFKYNKLDRGVYQLPVPTDAELSQFAQDMTKSTVKTKVVKAKATKVVTAKKVATKAVADDGESRLQSIIAESDVLDEDVEDFNQILRENGIEI